VKALRFAKDLYVGEQVDAAVKVYGRFGTLELAEDEDAWIVTVDAQTDARTRRLAGELANYALGLTIRQHRGEGAS
tara:strand:+ start:750 stop:977 length:228 start_codon:yes stop_codon:yes gene_type:complete